MRCQQVSARGGAFVRQQMGKVRLLSLARAVAVSMTVAVTLGPHTARAQHTCDPIDPIADLGWSVVPSEETISEVDGAPYQTASGGDWVIDRTITFLPFCNYFNAIGIYSMRSYTLSPRESMDRVTICKGAAQGASTPVP